MADQTFTLGVELETKGAQSGLKDLQKELQKTTESAKNVGKGFSAGLKDIDAGIKDTIGNLQGLAGRNGVGGVTDSVVGLTRGLGLAGGAFVGITAIAGAATLALIANASAMAAAADDAAELADNLGITTTELAAFQLLASETGTSAASLVATYDKLGKSLNEVQDGNIDTENSFRRLGIAQSDLAGKTREQIAGVVIKNYEALGRTVQATAAAQDILGRNFRENLSAIKASADGIEEYKNRVQEAGAVASKALVEAGAAQEKALSNLGLEVTGLRNNLASLFTSTVTDAATWSAGMLREVNKVLQVLNVSNVSTFEKFKIELEERAKLGLGGIFTGAVGGEADKATAASTKRILELSRERKAAEEAAAATERLRNYQGTSTAGPGRGLLINPPLVDLKKPEKEKDVVARLTEEQKALAAVGNLAGDTLNRLNDQIKLNGVETDSTTQAVTKYAQELFKLGKGYLTVEQAGNIAAGMQDKFKAAIESTNLAKINDDAKKLNTEYETALALLTATTDQQREQIRLRAQFNKIVENQQGGATPEQARAMADALAKANEQFAKLQTQKINNGVRDSLRDLTEQAADLTYEVENYWRASVYGVKDNTVALNQLFRQLDPEGRGKNISDAQKEALAGQVAIIERQKQLLEQNKQIEDSFRTLGSAVSDWALGSKDAIKNVKIELIKLIALQALKAYGGTGNSFADLFIGGFVNGLSGRASGGPVEAGKSYMVGEKGPEIVKFKQAGYVVPNHQIGSASPRTTMLTISPNLIIQGGVTGQSELDRAFEQFAGAMASETEKLIIRQSSQSGFLRAR